MLHWQHLVDEWLPIVVAVILSTFIGLIVTVLTVQFMAGDDAEKTP